MNNTLSLVTSQARRFASGWGNARRGRSNEGNMFDYENTRGFTEDEIDAMNNKLKFRCARAGVSPIASANHDNAKDVYDSICTKILEEAF